MSKRQRRGTQSYAGAGAGAVPNYNSSLLVGYVEEDETVEMIMKKFQAMEEVAQGKEQLNEEELQEVFKQTSLFSVESAVQQEEELEQEERYIIDYEEDEDGNFFFFDEQNGDSDDDAWDFFEHKVVTRQPRVKKERPPKEPRPAKVPKPVVMHGSSGTHRKMMVRKPQVPNNGVAYVRIPNDPIPSSWARRIRPYVPKQATLNAHTQWSPNNVIAVKPFKWSLEVAPDSKLVPAHDVFAVDFKALAKERGGFHGVVLNPPWKEPRPGTVLSAGFVPEDLKRLPLASREFLPCGFVFLWTPKHLLLKTLLILESMDLHYVENAIAMYRTVCSGPLVLRPCEYFAQSKETLLLCRRGDRNPQSGKIVWDKVELRHQRTSDVYDCCHRLGPVDPTTNHQRDVKPSAYVHKMVETILPEARYNVENPNRSGRFCEIWGQPSTSRSGWVNVFQAP